MTCRRGAAILRFSTRSLYASSNSAERDACRLPVTQTELAELCSVSRATVRKVMEELEARGAVACSYAELYVLSRKSILHALRDHLRSEA